MTNDNLKLSILVNGKSVYFNAPVFYTTDKTSGEMELRIKTEIGGKDSKQKIEIRLKNPDYVDPIEPVADDASPEVDKPDD